MSAEHRKRERCRRGSHPRVVPSLCGHRLLCRSGAECRTGTRLSFPRRGSGEQKSGGWSKESEADGADGVSRDVSERAVSRQIARVSARPACALHSRELACVVYCAVLRLSNITKEAGLPESRQPCVVIVGDGAHQALSAAPSLASMAFFASSKTALKPSGFAMASSARDLRSRSTLAALRPSMKRE